MTEPRVVDRAAALVPGYTVINHLSRGHRLDVYDVWSAARECRCVAKVLRPDCLHNSRARRQLIREGKLLVAASHPHLVRAYDLIQRPQPAVILETLSGDTLEGLIARRQRRLSRIEIAYLGLHLCSAVGYLHSRGVLHLDLKPSNVVSHRDGRAVVIDLSVAGRARLSRRPRGTARYMAPEQFRWGMFDTPADVWGIGIVLFASSAGRDPFEDGDRSRPWPSLAEFRPRFPPELIRIVDGCLSRRPADRPTISEITAELSALAELAGPVTPMPANFVPRGMNR